MTILSNLPNSNFNNIETNNIFKPKLVELINIFMINNLNIIYLKKYYEKVEFSENLLLIE